MEADLRVELSIACRHVADAPLKERVPMSDICFLGMKVTPTGHIRLKIVTAEC